MITTGDIISGDGFQGELHELVHGVSGFEYFRALEAARTGDGMVSQICFTRQIGMNVTLIINCATKSHNTVARPRFLHC